MPLLWGCSLRSRPVDKPFAALLLDQLPDPLRPLCSPRLSITTICLVRRLGTSTFWTKVSKTRTGSPLLTASDGPIPSMLMLQSSVLFLPRLRVTEGLKAKVLAFWRIHRSSPTRGVHSPPSSTKRSLSGSTAGHHHPPSRPGELAALGGWASPSLRLESIRAMARQMVERLTNEPVIIVSVVVAAVLEAL